MQMDLWRWWSRIVMLLAVAVSVSTVTAQGQLAQADLERIGKRIWQNECAGTVDGLTSWNSGEAFASLGIGHFIWYPTGSTGPFDESFPPLVAYLQRNGVSVPAWITQSRGCPWPNRTAFAKDKNSPRMKDLRNLLASTVALQTAFIMTRLETALPKFEAAAGSARGRVAANVAALRQSAAGNFALIDYVNFKGEGLKSTEQYNGQGWGLLQVLAEMKPSDARTAPAAFSEAAKAVLTRRVRNSPAGRNEKQWLPGWLNRCEAYKRP